LGIDRLLAGWDDENAFGVKTNWFGTARVRAGYSLGPALLYITGGAAALRVKNLYDNDTSNSLIFTRNETATGWTVGGGIEAALGGNWSAKTEYLYIDAGRQSVTEPDDGTHVFDNRFHVFRFGLNRKFGS
jgi:outer membrane immunogenic protein